MARRPNQLGPLVGTLNRKYGFQEFPRPAGVNTQSSPASLRPDQFSKLVNVRWNQGGIRPRAGYAKVVTETFHDATAKVYPHGFEISTPFRAWWAAPGYPGEGGSGFHIGFYDPEASPSLQRGAWYESASTAAHLGALGNTPYVGVDDELRKINLVQAPFGTDQTEVAGSSTDLPIASWDGETIRLIIAFDGMLFVFLEATPSHVETYDGLSIRADFDFPAVPVAAALYRDLLVVGLDDGKIYYRTSGDSPQDWTLVGTVGGVLGIHPGLNSMVSHKDVLYIANGEDDIWSWDGTTLGAAHVIGGTESVTCMAEAFGYLFYGYRDAGASELLIGRFDASGPTWDDTHKNLTDDNADQQDVISAMTLYKSELMIMVLDDATTKLGRTQAQDTDGTWLFSPLYAEWGYKIPYFAPI